MYVRTYRYCLSKLGLRPSQACDQYADIRSYEKQCHLLLSCLSISDRLIPLQHSPRLLLISSLDTIQEPLHNYVDGMGYKSYVARPLCCMIITFSCDKHLCSMKFVVHTYVLMYIHRCMHTYIHTKCITLS